MKLPKFKKITCPICPMLLKLLKWGYLSLHYLIIIAIFLFSFIIFIVFRNDGLEIIGEYVLKPMGINYEKSSGSLAKGFKLYNIHHKEFNIATLESKYDLVEILSGKHHIQSIDIDGAFINIEDFLSDDDGDFVWKFGTFFIDNLSITNLHLMSDYPLELDIYAKNGSFDGEIYNFKTLKANIKSKFVSGSVSGSVSNNRLKANGEAILSKAISNGYLPTKLYFNANGVIDKNIHIDTKIDKLYYDEMHIDDVLLSASYDFSKNYIDVVGKYKFYIDDISLDATQELRYSFDNQIHSKIKGLLETPYNLPNNSVDIGFTTNLKTFDLVGYISNVAVELKSDDLNNFRWNINSKYDDLNFIGLSNSYVDIKSNGVFSVDTKNIDGDLYIKNGDFDTNATIKNIDNSINIAGVLYSKQEFIKEYIVSKLDYDILYNNGQFHINASANNLNVNADMRDDIIDGFGQFNGINFDFNGDLKHLALNLSLPSLSNTLSNFHALKLQKGEYYDAQANAKIYIDLQDNLKIDAKISIPRYEAILDSQTNFTGVDNNITLSYSDNNIYIKNYYINIAEHNIYSNKTSIISTQDGVINIKELWIFDDLLATGVINKDKSIAIDIKSPRFTYKSPQGKVTLSSDITFKRSSDNRYFLYGDIDILDGLITQLPQYRIKDDDIIIIQDVRAPSNIDFFINVHIDTKKAIKYKTKELDIDALADITIYKESKQDIELLGMATVTKGVAQTAGKTFNIEKSYIHFDGSTPLNPYLDFTINHEVDYKKFKIYITHRLNSPIFLFSSDPVMSQNDIMSYILFGMAASDVGKSDTNGEFRSEMSNFMMGAGLKGLINSSTKLQIDTMNILTTTDGGIGFEVGARLSKDLRVLYKNDTVSNVLLQYAINRWLRLDIDVSESKQGINFIYIKDFRDFLPHK